MSVMYAIQAVDAGWEDPDSVSFDLEALKKRAMSFDYPVYIVKGVEVEPGVWDVSYDREIVWEWDGEKEVYLMPLSQSR